MSRWRNYYLDNHAHFCTASVADWKQVLTQSAHVLYEEWNHARKSYEVRILAYVVMPEHFHVVLWAERGESVKTFVGRTLGQVSKRLQPGGGLWKERPRILPVSSGEVLRVKVDYLHRNPLAKGLATNPEDWEHSSFRQLVLGANDVAFVCDDWGLISIR